MVTIKARHMKGDVSGLGQVEPFGPEVKIVP